MSQNEVKDLKDLIYALRDEFRNSTIDQTNYLEAFVNSRVGELRNEMMPVIEAFNTDKTFKEQLGVWAKRVGLFAATILAMKVLWSTVISLIALETIKK